ncbi:hypothetical protein PHJA_001569100 [Phtheirospermum japonicum]|uniref:S-protein homolog n=1 Tax=Phtheirospermum japonicum TaxID=374723 RepID=A0A830C566_9LAMI|nr:hypothetical protein PHJA_001569100 [Phtheirospermum japonicum]
MCYTNTMLRSSLQFLIISTILLQATSLEENRFCITRKFNVRVVDNIQPPGSAPLTLHCRSGDTDKGTHTLTTGQEFRFDFCIGLKTLFFCNVEWTGKTAGFQVFNVKWKTENYCKQDTCYWEARSDGIYHSEESSSASVTKICNWG